MRYKLFLNGDCINTLRVVYQYNNECTSVTLFIGRKLQVCVQEKENLLDNQGKIYNCLFRSNLFMPAWYGVSNSHRLNQQVSWTSKSHATQWLTTKKVVKWYDVAATIPWDTLVSLHYNLTFQCEYTCSKIF